MFYPHRPFFKIKNIFPQTVSLCGWILERKACTRVCARLAGHAGPGRGRRCADWLVRAWLRLGGAAELRRGLAFEFAAFATQRRGSFCEGPTKFAGCTKSATTILCPGASPALRSPLKIMNSSSRCSASPQTCHAIFENRNSCDVW